MKSKRKHSISRSIESLVMTSHPQFKKLESDNVSERHPEDYRKRTPSWKWMIMSGNKVIFSSYYHEDAEKKFKHLKNEIIEQEVHYKKIELIKEDVANNDGPYPIDQFSAEKHLK